jgi:hypothetical protein
MQYRLRTLALLTIVLPPLLATMYWSILWWRGHPPHPTLLVLVVLSHLVASLAGPILWYHELMYMISGPSPAQLARRKRRRVRVRIERYDCGSTYLMS